MHQRHPRIGAPQSALVHQLFEALGNALECRTNHTLVKLLTHGRARRLVEDRPHVGCRKVGQPLVMIGHPQLDKAGTQIARLFELVQEAIEGARHFALEHGAEQLLLRIEIAV